MAPMRLLSLGGLVALAFAQACSGAPTTPPPIPIALGGKHPDTAKAFVDLMLPEYDVVHVVHSSPIGLSELIPLLAGEDTIPASGLGSNSNTPTPQVPKAIFVGGGFSASEIAEMYNGTSLQMVPWVYPLPGGRIKGTIPPSVEVIVARVKQVFAENGFVPGNEDYEKTGVWAF